MTAKMRLTPFPKTVTMPWDSPWRQTLQLRLKWQLQKPKLEKSRVKRLRTSPLTLLSMSMTPRRLILTKRKTKSTLTSMLKLRHRKINRNLNSLLNRDSSNHSRKMMRMTRMKKRFQVLTIPISTRTCLWLKISRRCLNTFSVTSHKRLTSKPRLSHSFPTIFLL